MCTHVQCTYTSLQCFITSHMKEHSTQTCKKWLYIYMCIHAHIHVYTCTCTCVYMSVHLYMSLCSCVWMHTCTVSSLFFCPTHSPPSLLHPSPSIHDPEELAAIELQIKEFGQTPKQLFTKPHPRKTVVRKASHDHWGINHFRSALLLHTLFLLYKHTAHYTLYIHVHTTHTLHALHTLCFYTHTTYIVYI